jgi:hypothetical protein
LYIPKKITRIAAYAFRAVTDKLYVTAYHNSNLTTDTTGLGFGFFSYDPTYNVTTSRFTQTAPTIHLIYNYYDAAGLTLTTSSGIGSNFPLHILYPSGVKTINNRLAGYTGLKSINIPDTVTDINASAFSGCTGLTNVYISPNSNLTVLNNDAFSGCTALTTVFIPNSLKGINNTTFSGCTSLASVTYGNNPGIKYIGYQAFYDTTKALTSIFIPSSVVSIGSQAFITSVTTNVNILNTVRFGAGSRLRSIGGYCFGGASDRINQSATYLYNLVLPSTLRYMGGNSTADARTTQNAFKYNHSDNFVFPSSLTFLPFACLFVDTAPTDISNVYVPISITATAGPRTHNGYRDNTRSIGGVGGYIFGTSNAGSLIYLPSQLSGITTTASEADVAVAFPGTNRTRSFYKTVSYTDNPLTTLTLGGTVANVTNAATTTQIHADIKEGVIVIGDGTTSIDMSGTIDGSRNLISVNIPSTVTTISANAFNGCNALVYVTFSENSHLTTIGNSAFLGCSMIHDIQLPDTLTTIGPNAFSGCTNLATISIPYNVTSIGAGAFVNPFTQLGSTLNGTTITDAYGDSTVLSSDRTTLAVGAYKINTVYVYRYTSSWIQLGSSIIGSAYTNFGTSISLSSDGNTIAIGAPDAPDYTLSRGVVQVYKYYNSTWNRVGNATDLSGTSNFNYFGNSVSLSSDGTTVACGAYGNVGQNGQVQVFNYSNSKWNRVGNAISGVWSSGYFGLSVSLNSDGTTIACGAPYALSKGVVQVYKYYNSIWNIVGNATDLSGLGGSNLGTSVSLSSDGNTVACGASTYSTSKGLVQVFKYSNSWNRVGNATDLSGLTNNSNFGQSVSLSSDGTTLAVGAPGYSTNTGYVQIYKYTSSWAQIGSNYNGPTTNSYLGQSVSLSSAANTIAIGGSGFNTNIGLVQVFNISSLKSVQMHQRLYNDISGSLSTYFSGISTSALQVIPELRLTNTLNPAKLTISQINNMYIRYRQSQLGFCTKVTVSASSGDGILRASDITTALASSTGLVHLDFGSNVTSIDREVCLNNIRIYSVAISKTVVSLDTSVFNGCTNLTYLSFHPDSVCTTIGDSAFYRTNIIDLALPDSLTTIVAYAFYQSYSLTSVCIPKNVTSLGSYAFYDCSKLTSVALPVWFATYGTGTYFSTSGTTTSGITFTYYSATSASSAIPHFKLSDYSMPSGIVQTVIDSAVKYIDHRAYAYYPDITLYAVTTNKQTQTPGQYNYTANNVKFPIMPATFWVNGNFSGGSTTNSIFPIYRSAPDLNVYSLDTTAANWLDNTDDFYILMPGYSICIYNNLYDEENLFTDSPIFRYYDNEFGTVPLNITLLSDVINKTSSILIMSNGRILSKYFAS